MPTKRPPAPKPEEAVTPTVVPEAPQAPEAPDGAPTVEQVIAVLQRERRIRQQLEAINGRLTGENIELQAIIAELNPNGPQ